MDLNDKCRECGCTRDMHVDADVLNRTGKLDFGPCTRCTCQQFVELLQPGSAALVKERLEELSAELRRSPVTPEPPPVNRDDESDITE